MKLTTISTLGVVVALAAALLLPGNFLGAAGAKNETGAESTGANTTASFNATAADLAKAPVGTPLWPTPREFDHIKTCQRVAVSDSNPMEKCKKCIKKKIRSGKVRREVKPESFAICQNVFTTCSDRGTDGRLNDLFNNRGASTSAAPSFMNSGFFTHGFDCQVGQQNPQAGGSGEGWGLEVGCILPGFHRNTYPGFVEMNEAIAAARPVPTDTNRSSNRSTIDYAGLNASGTVSTQAFTIDDVMPDGYHCPGRDQGGSPLTYPSWCPTAQAQISGFISTAFIRRDVTPPKLNERTTALFPGGGVILTGPTDDGSTDSTFWDGLFGETGGRVMGAYPHDASTLQRSNCGVGPDIVSLKFGVGQDGAQAVPAGGEALPNGGGDAEWCPVRTATTTWCPTCSSFKELIAAATASTFQSWCPDEVQDHQQYYPLTDGRSQEIQPIVLANKDDYMFWADDKLSDAVVATNQAQSLAQCAVDNDRFDSVFVPAATYENMNDYWKGYTAASGDAWNEVLLRPWDGEPNDELSKHMVLFYPKLAAGEEARQEELRNKAYEVATAFYWRNGIAMPVVQVDNGLIVGAAQAEANPVTCG